MSFKEQIKLVNESLKPFNNVKVVAATKYFNIDETKELINQGIKDIGENRKEVFLEKYEALKDLNITWHYFGVIKIPPKLQPEFIDKIDYLHSLDSIDLANAINKTRTVDTPLKCFVYVNISGAQHKAGLDESKVIPFIKSLAKYPKIEVVGLMTTGKNTYDEDESRMYFNAMKDIQEEVQALKIPNCPCKELSMGASEDYLIAASCGATFVRLGTIFTE